MMKMDKSQVRKRRRMTNNKQCVRSDPGLRDEKKNCVYFGSVSNQLPRGFFAPEYLRLFFSTNVKNLFSSTKLLLLLMLFPFSVIVFVSILKPKGALFYADEKRVKTVLLSISILNFFCVVFKTLL